MRYIWSGFGIIISSVAAFYFWDYLPPNLIEQIELNKAVFSAGFGLLIPAYICRAIKAFILLPSANTGRWQITCSLYASIALNNVLPFRLGDVLRLFYLRTILGIPLAITTSTLLIERVVDLTIILLLFLVALISHSSVGLNFFIYLIRNTPSWIFLCGGLLALIVIALLFIFRKKLIVFFQSTIGSLNLNFLRLTIFLIAATTQWILEIIALSLILSLSIKNVPFFEAILSSFMSNLATLVPSAPGYVGTFEIAGIMPFQFFLGFVAPEQALFVVIYHLIIWTFSSCLGFISLVILLSIFKLKFLSIRLHKNG